MIGCKSLFCVESHDIICFIDSYKTWLFQLAVLGSAALNVDMPPLTTRRETLCRIEGRHKMWTEKLGLR